MRFPRSTGATVQFKTEDGSAEKEPESGRVDDSRIKVSSVGKSLFGTSLSAAQPMFVRFQVFENIRSSGSMISENRGEFFSYKLKSAAGLSPERAGSIMIERKHASSDFREFLERRPERSYDFEILRLSRPPQLVPSQGTQESIDSSMNSIA